MGIVVPILFYATIATPKGLLDGGGPGGGARMGDRKEGTRYIDTYIQRSPWTSRLYERIGRGADSLSNLC